MLNNDNVNKAPQKNANAFWALWFEHKTRLQNSCLRWLNGNHASAEDALSQTIEKAYHHFLSSDEEIINPFLWLCKIAHNICVDIHREQKKQNLLYEMATNTPDQFFFSTFESEELEETLQRESQLESVYFALSSLSPDLKRVIYHRFIDEMEYSEIAENMHTTQENVRKRVQLVRKQLRVLFV